MDNASKALIMAGGILIGVLIISVSLYIFTTARGLADDSNREMKINAAESFNRFYQSFDNNSTITGLDALNIINKAKDDNWRCETKRTSEHYITFGGNYDSIISSMEDSADGINEMKKSYSYHYEKDADGYIDTIVINKINE